MPDPTHPASSEEKPKHPLQAAREALPSPSGAPRLPMSRQELAEAANAYVWQHTRGRQRITLTEHDIGRYERGQTRWPNQWRRYGLRGVLGAATDRDLGFYPNRRTSAVKAATITTEREPLARHGSTDTTDPATATGQPGARSEVAALGLVPQRPDLPGTRLVVTAGEPGGGGHGLPSDTLPDQRGSVEDDEVNRRGLLAAGASVTAVAMLSAPTRVVQALAVVASDGADSIAVVLHHLDELVSYYSEAVCRTPSASLYEEMQGVRSYTGWLLAQPQRRASYRSELTVAAGWLSNLLAVAASYLGDHTSALVWCCDAERRSHEAGHPELAGWAVLTKAMIAYYQGRTARSVALAASGQQVAPEGGMVRAKLAAQEMRARAMVGDADGMAQAKRRATTALARVPAGVAASGAFSVAPAPEPPYTATSLLLVGEFEEAASATGRVLDTVYHGPANHQGRQTSNYARTLLILGLAEAGLGRAAEAAAAGNTALSCATPVWPTMVLAHKLDQVLTRRFSGVAEARDYHELCTATASQLPDRPTGGP